MVFLKVFVAKSSLIHPQWKKNKTQGSAYNIAIIELPEESKRSVPQMLFDHFNLHTGQKLIALGWGTSGDEPALGEDICSDLKMEPQEFLSAKHCNMTNLRNGTVQDNTCCGE